MTRCVLNDNEAAAGNGGSDGVGDDNDAVAYYPANYPNANLIAVALADDDRQVDDVGPRQKLAEAELGIEFFGRHPALFLDQVAVHDRDLTSGAAKAVERHLDPQPERLFKVNLFDLNAIACVHGNLDVLFIG